MTDTITIDTTDTTDTTCKPEFVIERVRKTRPYFGMLYGSPGVGKTTLAAAIPGALVIDLENGADGFDCNRITVESCATPRATIARIKRAIAFAVSQGFTTIIVDSVSALVDIFEKEFLIENGKTCLDTGNFGQDYQAINEMLKSFLGGQTAQAGTLPYLASKGCNLLLIGHEKERVDSVGDSKLLYSIAPNLFKGAVSWLQYQCDFIFYYTYDIVIKEENLGMTKDKLSATRGRKILTCQQGGILAKNRFGLPPVIREPSEKIFKEIFDASRIKEEQKNV